MPFQRFVKFAATAAGTTVITSSAVLTGFAAIMVDNHLGWNYSVNNLSKRIEKLDEQIDKLDEKVDRNQEEILLNIQQTTSRTIKALDGDKEPLKQFVRWYDNCLKLKAQGLKCKRIQDY